MKQFLLFTSVMLVNNAMCMQNCSTFGPNTSYINGTVVVSGLVAANTVHPNTDINLRLKQIVNQKTSQPIDIKQCLSLFKYGEEPRYVNGGTTPHNTSKNTTKIQRGEQYQYQRDFDLAQNVQHESYLKSNQEAVQQENQEQRLCRSFLNNTDALCSQNSTPVSPQSYETSQILLNTQDLLVSSQGRNQEYNVINFQDKQAESQQSHTKQYGQAYCTLNTIKKPEAQKQEQSVQVDNTKQLEQQIQRLQECVENLKLKHKKMEDQGYEIRLQNIVNQDNEQKIQRLEERETYYLEIIKKLTGYGMYYQDTIKQLTETKSELLQHNNELRKESLQYKNVIKAYLVKHNKQCDELRLLIQRNDELLTGICQLKETNQHTNITLYNTKQDKNRLLRQTKDQEHQIQQLNTANNNLQNQVNQFRKSRYYNDAIKASLAENNKIYKTWCHKLNQYNCQLKTIIDGLQRENKDKIQTQASQFTTTISELQQQLKMIQEQANNKEQQLQKQIEDLMEKNKKLQEENDILAKSYQMSTQADGTNSQTLGSSIGVSRIIQ